MTAIINSNQDVPMARVFSHNKGHREQSVFAGESGQNRKGTTGGKCVTRIF